MEPEDDGRTLGDEIAEEAAASTIADVIPARGPAAYVAEFIGTFALVLFITMVVSQFAHAAPSASELAQGAQQQFVDFSVIGLLHVFVLFFLIQTLAVVSGAHFNPAVTAALTAVRQIRPIDSAIYIVVQLAGGVLGALVTKLILNNFDNAKAVNYGAPALGNPLDGKVPLGMLVEGLGAFPLGAAARTRPALLTRDPDICSIDICRSRDFGGCFTHVHACVSEFGHCGGGGGGTFNAFCPTREFVCGQTVGCTVGPECGQ